MGGRDEPGHNAQTRLDHKRPAHRQAAHEVVHAVGQQNQIPERAVRAYRAVAMVPLQILLEKKEGEQADGDPAVDGQVVAEGIHRRRDHVEQRAAQQRTRGQRHQRKYQFVEDTLGQHKVIAPTSASALMSRPETTIHPSAVIAPSSLASRHYAAPRAAPKQVPQRCVQSVDTSACAGRPDERLERSASRPPS